MEFSNETPVFAAVSFLGPALYRIVVTDTELRIEGRWRPLRALMQPRTCSLDEIESARLRGTLVILYLPRDEWWSISTATKAQKIIGELESHGVQVARDA